MALQGGPCHASVQESFYYLGPHHPRCQRQQACLREVVQFPLVALETQPPRADPPVDLVRQVRPFSHCTSQVGEGGCLAVLLSRGVEDYLRCRCARGIGMHMVSVVLSEMVRPNAPKTSTKTAIIRPSPRVDRDTMHASSAYKPRYVGKFSAVISRRVNNRRSPWKFHDLHEVSSSRKSAKKFPLCKHPTYI